MKRLTLKEKKKLRKMMNYLMKKYKIERREAERWAFGFFGFGKRMNYEERCIKKRSKRPLRK